MTGIERILCPVDVEHPAHAALACALAVAERFDASVHVVHVQGDHDEAPLRLFGSRAGDVEKLMSAHSVEQRLEGVVGTRPSATRVSSEVVWGQPTSAILALSRQRRSDLIVIGSSSRATLGWRRDAGVADELSPEADCPVLTVPETDARSPIERILLPVDFSAATTAAASWAAALAVRYGASVDVLHALSGMRSANGRRRLPEVTRSLVAKALTRLRETESLLRQAGVQATSSAVVESGTLDAILARNESEQTDLVVMGMHDRLERRYGLCAGMVATVRNHLPLPILSVRATEPDWMFTGSAHAAGDYVANSA